MALKSGRAVSVKERPVYTRMTELVLDGTIHAFWLLEPGKITVQTAPEAEREVFPLSEVQGIVLGEIPTPKRTGKAELLTLVRKLVSALDPINGYPLPMPAHESLLAEANRLIAAA